MRFWFKSTIEMVDLVSIVAVLRKFDYTDRDAAQLNENINRDNITFPVNVVVMILRDLDHWGYLISKSRTMDSGFLLVMEEELGCHPYCVVTDSVVHKSTQTDFRHATRIEITMILNFVFLLVLLVLIDIKTVRFNKRSWSVKRRTWNLWRILEFSVPGMCWELY